MSRERRGGGACRFPLSRPSPPREGSTQPAKLWPSSLRQRWREGRDWLGIKWGCCWGALPWGGGGKGGALAPKLGPSLLREESASPPPPKKKGLAESTRHPAAGQERVWTVLQFWGSRPVGFPHPLFSPRTLLQPTADVYPRSLLGNGTFVILLAGGRSTLLIPDTRPATDFLCHSSLSLIYLHPHTFPEAS